MRRKAPNYDAFKKENKLFQLKSTMKRNCECGHRISFYAFEKKDFKICKYCGKAVYRNDRIAFRYKLRRELKNVEIK